LILGPEPFNSILLFQGEHSLLVGILRSLLPTFHLIRLQARFLAIGACSVVFSPAVFSTNVNFSAADQPSASFSDVGTISLPSPGFPPVVEGDEMNAQLC